jgi:predicted AAA+ superfamily ATPase
LTDRKDLVAVFDGKLPFEEKVARFELIAGKKIDAESTVIFFDEVQESEGLIEALKFFAESKPDFKIVCAGSLLGVKLRRFRRSFPVGKVTMLYMQPMDFEEFLIACGQELFADEVRKCFRENRNMFEPLHERGLTYYRNYLCVGGMPEAVAHCIAVENDMLRFDARIQEDILSAYLDDMTKYVWTPLEASRIRSVYRSLPSQLGNQSRKFQYSKIRQGARSKSYESAISWLLSSGMVYSSTAVTRPETPLKGYLAPNIFKLYINDPGLLCSLAGIKFPDVMLDRAFDYKGVLTECYVAGQLIAGGASLHYWRSDNTAEVDFLLDHAEGVVPVEVKSGNNKRSASLEVYVKRYEPPFSVRVTARNFGLYGGIKSAPLYAAFCLPELEERKWED